MDEQKPVPVAVSFLQSRIMQGLLTVFVSLTLNMITRAYKLDLSSWGTPVPDIVQGITYGVAYLGVIWAGHARTSPNVPIPPTVTLTAASAQQLNEQAGTPTEKSDGKA
jgi:hypothetical protein